jgi:hypothetical protein
MVLQLCIRGTVTLLLIVRCTLVAGKAGLKVICNNLEIVSVI